MDSWALRLAGMLQLQVTGLAARWAEDTGGLCGHGRGALGGSTRCGNGCSVQEGALPAMEGLEQRSLDGAFGRAIRPAPLGRVDHFRCLVKGAAMQ